MACATPASFGGCGSTASPSSHSARSLCCVTTSDEDEKPDSLFPCSSWRLPGDRFAPWERDGVAGSQRTSCRALELLSALTPLLPLCVSLQDNQELRTTKHPATSLCQEPPPALHVSASVCCPLFPLLPMEM